MPGGGRSKLAAVIRLDVVWWPNQNPLIPGRGDDYLTPVIDGYQDFDRAIFLNGHFVWTLRYSFVEQVSQRMCRRTSQHNYWQTHQSSLSLSDSDKSGTVYSGSGGCQRSQIHLNRR